MWDIAADVNDLISNKNPSPTSVGKKKKNSLDYNIKLWKEWKEYRSNWAFPAYEN